MRRIIFFLFFLPLLLWAAPVSAATYISGNISTSTVWTQLKSPYVVQGSLNVLSGATLTIEPGVVVKLNVTSSLDKFSISGTLNAEGTFVNRVYFTSYKDDMVGGDTNGDGIATSPQAGDWTSIYFNSGSVGNMSNAIVRYGGRYSSFNGCYCSLVNIGGSVNLTDVSITDTNKIGIRQRGGSLIADGLELSRHQTALWLENSLPQVNLSQSRFNDNAVGIQADTGVLVVTDTVFARNQTAAQIAGSVGFTHSGNTATGGAKSGFVISGTLGQNQIWNADGMPYIIGVSSPLYVPAGLTLSIEEGAVVKSIFSSTFNYMNIKGNLVVNGSADKKVYFTSLKDDTVGGDTNGDEAGTAPAPGNWTGIFVQSGGTADISNAVVRYAGAYTTLNGCNCALANMGTMNIVDSQIASSSASGVKGRSGILTVTNSEIFKNVYGLSLENGTASISQSSLHDNAAYSATTWGNVINAENNWWGDATGPYHATNLGGTAKSRVSNNVDFTPWLGEDPLYKPEKPDPVVIIPGILGSAEKNGEWVIDPIFHTYDDLIDTLVANGYEEEVDLFTLPYDWRQSNVTTATELRDKINEIEAICKCKKVDLVAHSMGGLVARQYIQSGEYENDVDQLIFLGTPHLGAPKAYLMWEGGEMDVSSADSFLKFILSREAKKAGFASLYDYVRNKPIPSVQQLLPIYDYIHNKDSENLRTYPDNYPANTFLDNLNDTSSVLFNSSVKISNIIGDTGTSTINTIRVVDSSHAPLWENGYPDEFYEKKNDRGLERGIGDSTVPIKSSALNVSDQKQISSEHNELVTKAENLIYKKLTGKDPTTSFYTNSLWNANFKLLIIKILSPVDVQVIAPDGKRIGKDFSTGNEINEITGAFYSGFLTDDEYVTIPNPLDGEYKIETVGTGEGSYTIASGYISDNASADKDFTAQTEPGKVEEINLSVDSSSPSSLEIKPTDVTPPEIIIDSPQAKDYLRSENLPISIVVQDPESGAFSQTFKFDDRMVNDGDTVDLFFEKLGNHSVDVIATDFVGNTASTTVDFRNIATIESTISNIERAFSLGWIDNQGIKKSLSKKLEVVGKQEKHIYKNLGKAFIGELEAQRGKHINEQAFQVLLEDINWLLDN